MNSENIKKLEDKYVAGTYARFDLAIVSGQGSRCKDAEGNEYIDFTSGIGVNSLGYSNPGWVKAVSEQAAKLQHTSNLYYTEPCSKLAEKLIDKTGMEKVFFCNSGAEANEGAIKAARKYSKKKYGEDVPDNEFARVEIITLIDSFHGRTVATVSATGQDSFHVDFAPFLSGFNYAVTNDVSDLHNKVNANTCAIMFETVQGEGGVNNLSDEYIKEIVKICSENDILLIVDEVQTGIGRTGKFMSYQHYGFNPDIVTIAKGIGGGLPIGAILFGKKTENVLAKGDHGSTFGGNPVVCAGADYVASIMDEDFLTDVIKKGELFKEKLNEIDEVAEVSGKGLMIGISLKTMNNSEIARKCIENGLLVLTAKDKIRFLPPLNISEEDILEGMEIFIKTFQGF